VRLPDQSSSGISLKPGHTVISNWTREGNCRKPCQSILMSFSQPLISNLWREILVNHWYG
jgi:hypothetical protein